MSACSSSRRGRSQLLRDKIKAKVKATPTGRRLDHLIEELNPVIIGWRNYFRYACRAVREFAKHDRWLWWRVSERSTARRLMASCAEYTPSEVGRAAVGAGAGSNSLASPRPNGCATRI